MSRHIKNVIIKRFPRDRRWYVIDADSGNTVCNIGLYNVDSAIEWLNIHYPEVNSKVQDDYSKESTI